MGSVAHDPGAWGWILRIQLYFSPKKAVRNTLDNAWEGPPVITNRCTRQHMASSSFAAAFRARSSAIRLPVKHRVEFQFLVRAMPSTWLSPRQDPSRRSWAVSWPRHQRHRPAVRQDCRVSLVVVEPEVRLIFPFLRGRLWCGGPPAGYSIPRPPKQVVCI